MLKTNLYGMNLGLRTPGLPQGGWERIKGKSREGDSGEWGAQQRLGTSTVKRGGEWSENHAHLREGRHTLGLYVVPVSSVGANGRTEGFHGSGRGHTWNVPLSSFWPGLSGSVQELIVVAKGLKDTLSCLSAGTAHGASVPRELVPSVARAPTLAADRH